MLTLLIIAPPPKSRWGAIYVRQSGHFREQFRRGNALTSAPCRLDRTVRSRNRRRKAELSSGFVHKNHSRLTNIQSSVFFSQLSHTLGIFLQERTSPPFKFLNPVFRWLQINVMMAGLPWDGVRYKYNFPAKQRGHSYLCIFLLYVQQLPGNVRNQLRLRREPK